MSAVASQITSPTIVYSTVYSGPDQRKHQSCASLAFWGEFTGDRWIPHTKGQYVLSEGPDDFNQFIKVNTSFARY